MSVVKTAVRCLAVSPPTTLAMLVLASGAVAQQPIDHAEQYRACMVLANRNPEQALESAGSWSRQGGGDAAEHCAGVALIGLGKFEEAAERLQAAANASSAKAAVRAGLLSQAGQAWLLAGEAVRASAVLSDALRLTPDDAAILVDRSRAAADLGRYKESIADLDKAIRLMPKMVDAYVFRASAYRHLDDLQRAESDANAALGLDPSHPEGLLERGIVRRLRGDKDGARQDWQTLLQAAPHSEAAALARGNLQRLDAPPSQM